MTYKELWSSSVCFANELQQIGVAKRDRVVVRVERFLETFVAQFGIYIAGGVYCPITKGVSVERTEELMKEFDTNVLVSSLCINNNVKFINIGKIRLANCTTVNENFDLPKKNDLATIIFTTGTTGKSKGVMLSYATAVDFAYKADEIFSLNERHTYAWVQPLHLVQGVRGFPGFIFAGGSVAHLDGLGFFNELSEAIPKYKITHMHFQPFGVNFILNINKDFFRPYSNQLEGILFGGGLVPKQMLEMLHDNLPSTKLFVRYGATETATIAHTQYDPESYETGCAGTPCNGSVVRIVDENRQEIKNSSKENFGIIETKNDANMIGYWNSTDLTEAVLDDRRLLMTDMGYFDKNGKLFIIGRRDDVIVYGGFKIAPYDIEAVALEIPEIAEAALVGVKDDVLSNYLCLFVSLKSGAEFPKKKLAAHLSKKLEHFKIPKKIICLDKLPTVIGSQKISRKSLREYAINLSKQESKYENSIQ